MKKLSLWICTIILIITTQQSSYAQSDLQRNQLQLTIKFGGKDVVTPLTTVSTSITRSFSSFTPKLAGKDTTKQKELGEPSAFYLSLSAKQASNDLLKIFSKNKTQFDGTITLVDTYGKNPTRTIVFRKASLYSYSDQLTPESYNDSYGAVAITLLCEELTINGVTMEQ